MLPWDKTQRFKNAKGAAKTFAYEFGHNTAYIHSALSFDSLFTVLPSAVPLGT